ncbi:MAG: MotA/TolQ/ExbB proton channel family protein [Oligoflexus sp.]
MTRPYVRFWSRVLAWYLSIACVGLWAWQGELTPWSQLLLAQDAKSGLDTDADPLPEGETMTTVELGSQSFLMQAWRSGMVVFTVLVILMIFSVLSWALFLAKWLHLRKLSASSDQFIKNFWDSRSLNELNGRLGEYPYSPAKEIFRSGYAELVKGSQLKEQTSSLQLAVHAAIENLGRSLHKAKRLERKRMERYLPLLAIIASSAPFIGLFGTVWGIMNSFAEIARTGSASLAAVAPGISEALIATAFGLAAAIPAVIAYNTASANIRSLLTNLDGFSSDFLNIVERYLVTERKANSSSANPL